MAETLLTIKQAEERIKALEYTIDWIECIINEDVRRDREIVIEDPPIQIHAYLEEQLETSKDEADYLRRTINEILNNHPLVPMP